MPNRLSRSVRAWVRTCSFPLLHLLLVLLPTPSSCAPRPDDNSSQDSNSVDMLVISPQPVAVPSIGGSSSGEVNYYIPVIMAEMAAPVSTREPSIIRVSSCRQGFGQDPAGNCRQAFTPMPYLPSSRPDRNVNVQSIISRVRAPPRPRVVPQTQRDLVRQFNTSRRRPSWFGRSIDAPEGNSSDGLVTDLASGVPLSDPLAGGGGGGGPMPPSAPSASTTTEKPKTTTPDHDD
ncbi:uncharacterized protein LOC119578662 isoform X2 [Penaeus monodon]|uniref:uncharacterized protein LOC119578662 isoform X2 n=1 Tax=Penaeus monodon TaxID=6687 RepID=UPI0018A6FF5B|nr:uncharacterized protein LOC119578662 isoform X2 [Penaeus monodon]